MPPHFNVNAIPQSAAKAGIELTEADREMLGRIQEFSRRLRELTPVQKLQFGIPMDVEPKLKIGWEVEFHIHSDDPAVKKVLRNPDFIEYLQPKLPSFVTLKRECSLDSSDKGEKLEVASEAKPAEEAVVDYFAFRERLKQACDKEGLSVRRYSSHLHYSLCDEQGYSLFTGSNNRLTGKLADRINDTLLESVYHCLPLAASKRQIIGNHKQPPVCNILDIGDEENRTYAIRALPDSTYQKNALIPSSSYHFELRRTHPGPDNQLDLGFDPFVASVTLLAGSTTLAAEGHQPKTVPKQWSGLKTYEERCEFMRNSEQAKTLLGEELTEKISLHLLYNKELSHYWQEYVSEQGQTLHR